MGLGYAAVRGNEFYRVDGSALRASGPVAGVWPLVRTNLVEVHLWVMGWKRMGGGVMGCCQLEVVRDESNNWLRRVEAFQSGSAQVDGTRWVDHHDHSHM